MTPVRAVLCACSVLMRSCAAHSLHRSAMGCGLSSSSSPSPPTATSPLPQTRMYMKNVERLCVYVFFFLSSGLHIIPRRMHLPAVLPPLSFFLIFIFFPLRSPFYSASHSRFRSPVLSSPISHRHRSVFNVATRLLDFSLVGASNGYVRTYTHM